MLILSFSLLDMLWIFVFGIIFILIFYFQRLRYPSYYFEFGEIIYGFRTNIKLLSFLIRILVIVGYGFFLSMVCKNSKIPILAATFGAFLIVWPGFFHHDIIYYQIPRKHILLYTSYVVFILLSASGAYLGYLIYCFIGPLFGKYWHGIFHTNRFFTLILNGVVFMVFVGVLRRITTLLDKEIKFRKLF